MTGWCFSDQLLRSLAMCCSRRYRSTHVSTTLTRASSVGKQPLLFTKFFLLLPTFNYHLLLSFLFPFCMQVFHSAFNHLCCICDCSGFVSACSRVQRLLYHDAIHLTENVFDDLHQNCPFWFFDCCVLPIWVCRRQMHSCAE